MRYNKQVTEAQKKELLKALETVLEMDTDFMVMFDMEDMAFVAGSERMGLVRFMTMCMLSDEGTAQLFMNVVLNYILNKLNVEGCEACPVQEHCKSKRAEGTVECGDEALAVTIKKLLERMQPSKN